MNPYKINEPAAISFSGGRTSAYMLYKILEAHNGKLPDDVHVTFANTGKEMPETLDFVQACSDHWGVDIVWLEFAGTKKSDMPKVVNHTTAARNGEPFEAMIKQKKYLPSPPRRFCTQELKIYPIEKYMVGEFLTVVGIRADEPRRAAKQRAKEGYAVPLVDAGIGIHDIKRFWDCQNFDLELPKSPEGYVDYSNCDLCFLKNMGIKRSIIRGDPSRVDWWAAQEEKIEGRFRFDHPSYAQMKVIASDQGQLFDFDDESIPCFCGD